MYQSPAPPSLPPRRPPGVMRGTGSAPTAVGGGHGPGRLAPVLGLAQGLALVPVLLAPGQGDLQLGPPADEVQLEWDDRVPLGLHLDRQAPELGAVEQQFALAARGVVVPGALEVLGDVRTL